MKTFTIKKVDTKNMSGGKKICALELDIQKVSSFRAEDFYEP